MSSSTDLHYDNAPIVEAVVGFSYSELEAGRLPELEAFGETVKPRYPKVAPFQPKSSDTESSDQAPTGYTFSDDSTGQVIRLTLREFSFSKLAPYDQWGPFIGEAKRTWELAQGVLDGATVETFYVRYFNQISIPTGVPLRELFNIYPALPDPNTLFDNFYLFAESSIDDFPCRVRTLMFPSRDKETREVRIVLDNAFFFKTSDPSNIWKNIDQIRKIKNDTFQSQITAATKESLR